MNLQMTNAMRLLSAAKIPYDSAEYEYIESDLSGVTAATHMGRNCASVYKTLVLKGDKCPYLVCCIAVDKELDLKNVASAMHCKRVEMLPLKDLTAVTGYVRGGCSPIGMKKNFPVIIDRNALNQATIAISAGKRGLQIIIKPDDLISFLNAVVADIIR